MLFLAAKFQLEFLKFSFSAGGAKSESGKSKSEVMS